MVVVRLYATLSMRGARSLRRFLLVARAAYSMRRRCRHRRRWPMTARRLIRMTGPMRVRLTQARASLLAKSIVHQRLVRARSPTTTTTTRATTTSTTRAHRDLHRLPASRRHLSQQQRHRMCLHRLLCRTYRLRSQCRKCPRRHLYRTCPSRLPSHTRRQPPLHRMCPCHRTRRTCLRRCLCCRSPAISSDRRTGCQHLLRCRAATRLVCRLRDHTTHRHRLLLVHHQRRRDLCPAYRCRRQPQHRRSRRARRCRRRAVVARALCACRRAVSHRDLTPRWCTVRAAVCTRSLARRAVWLTREPRSR
jgi:hypothetical protein